MLKSFSVYISKKLNQYAAKETHALTFAATRFTITKKLKQPKYNSKKNARTLWKSSNGTKTYTYVTNIILST